MYYEYKTIFKELLPDVNDMFHVRWKTSHCGCFVRIQDVAFTNGSILPEGWSIWRGLTADQHGGILQRNALLQNFPAV